MPFAVLGAMGLTISVLATGGDHYLQSGAALAVGSVCGVLAAVSIRRWRRTWIDPVPAWLFFVALALLHQLPGGSSAGIDALIALPIFWLALFGTRRDLMVAAVLVVATCTLPDLMTSDISEPTDIVRALLWTATTLLVAPVIQRMVRDLAAQRASEQRSAATLRGVMDGATLTSLIGTDARGMITSFSQGAVDLLGYRAEEVVGIIHSSVLHDRAELEAVADEFGLTDPALSLSYLAHKKQPARIWSYLRKDGTPVLVRLAMTELADDDGVVLGYVGVAIDSTAAEESTRALAESEERWHAVVDHLPDTVVMAVDEDLHISMLAGAESGAYGRAGADGNSLATGADPDNLRMFTGGVRAAFDGQVAQVEFTSSRLGGRRQFTFCPLPTPFGDRPEVLILVRNVTVARERERAVATARDRAESLLTSAPHGVAVIRRNALIEQVNPALCALLGRDEAELVGLRLTALPDSDQTIMTDLVEVMADNLPGSPARHVEWTVRPPGGNRSYLAVGSTVVAGPDEDQILLTFTDLSERHRHEEELSWLAEHDPLTGLANRRRFESALAHHLTGCRSSGVCGALLMIDLDHFKAVNDTEGHSVGDQVLVTVADTLRTAVRSTDLVARLGGDEFAVLLPDADALGAEVVAGHVVEMIRASVGAGIGGHGVTASVGIVMIDGDQLDPEAVMATADLTMYDAKNGGRDRWVALGRRATDTERAPQHRGWSAQLQHALRHDELVLHLRPTYVAAAGRVAGAEVLVLLRDGDRLIPSEEFLVHVGRTDLIRALDHWVIDGAVEILGRLHQIDPFYRLGLTLSGSSLDDPTLHETVTSALARHGISDPATLVLALSETRSTADPVRAGELLRPIAETGCLVALDNFGAGFASLSYLRHLPVGSVRIAESFVAGCAHDDSDLAIVSMAIEVAHRLGAFALTPGVIDAETFTAVIAEGADSMQGDHIGRPLAFEEYVVAYGVGAAAPVEV